MLRISPIWRIRLRSYYASHRVLWRLYLRNVSVVLGFSFLSVCIVCTTDDYPPWIRSFFQPKIERESFSNERLAGALKYFKKQEEYAYVDTKVADDLFHKVNILCYVLSTKSEINRKIQVVNSTWARRCNKVLYIMCYEKKAHDILSTCEVYESKSHLTAKVRYTLKYIYQNYFQDYDWFLKADDDTYMVMENLRYMLSHYPVDKPGYLGYHFHMFLNQGYMSGGAGYVINKRALQLVNERAFKSSVCKEDHKDEDLEIGRCLELSGVNVFPSLDKFNRETFHTDKPWEHVSGEFPKYLKFYSKNFPKAGLNCCSQFPVSYHHLEPQTMFMLEDMLYGTSVYGRRVMANMRDMFQPRIIPP